MTNPEPAYTAAYITQRVTEHFMNVLYFDLGRYLIAAGAMTVLLLVFRGWAKARRIQTRRAARKDYTREVLSSLRTVFVFAIMTLATLIGREFGVINLKIDSAPLLTVAWQFALIVITHDAYFYWIHRAMHTKRLFNATHLHHHKSRTPTPWTAYSFSSWEAAAEAAFVPLFLLLTSTMGLAYAGMAMLFFLWHMIIRNVMAHTGHEIFPAGWVDNPLTSWISTTTHHDLHHSSGHNFGFYFTFWDRWMGTEHPRYAEEFRKNAKPYRLPNLGRASKVGPSKVRTAEKISVLMAALLAGAVTLNGWWIAAEPGLL